MNLSDADLDALETAVAAMAPGEWTVDVLAIEHVAQFPYGHRPLGVGPGDEAVAALNEVDTADAAGIVALRNNATALIAGYREARAALLHGPGCSDPVHRAARAALTPADGTL